MKREKFKRSGNPVIDCNNAYNLGYKEGGEEAIIIARHLAMLPIYNIVHKYVKSEKKQLEMVREYALEHNRVYVDEFLNNQDKVLQGMEGVKRIYKECGLTEDGYGEM